MFRHYALSSHALTCALLTYAAAGIAAQRVSVDGAQKMYIVWYDEMNNEKTYQ